MSIPTHAEAIAIAQKLYENARNEFWHKYPDQKEEFPEFLDWVEEMNSKYAGE